MEQLSKILSVFILMISFQAEADLGSFISQAYNRLTSAQDGKASAQALCKKIQLSESSACHKTRTTCLDSVSDTKDSPQFNSKVLNVCHALADHRLAKNCDALKSCVQRSVENSPISSQHSELCQQVAKSKNGSNTIRCLQAELSDHLIPLCLDAAKWGHYSYANECIAAIDGKSQADISSSAVGICRVRAGSSAEIHMRGMITCIENAEVKTRGESDVQQRVNEHRSSSVQQ